MPAPCFFESLRHSAQYWSHMVEAAWMMGVETSLWFGLANKSTPVKVSKKVF